MIHLLSFFFLIFSHAIQPMETKEMPDQELLSILEIDDLHSSDKRDYDFESLARLDQIIEIFGEEIIVSSPPDFICFLCDNGYDSSAKSDQHNSSKSHLIKLALLSKKSDLPIAQPIIQISQEEDNKDLPEKKLESKNICPSCKKNIKGSLINHMRVHSGQKPYHCSACDYASTQLDNCKRHIRHKHHSIHEMADVIDLVDEEQKIVRAVEKETYMCEICNKEFYVKSDFSRHTKKHSKL